MRKILTEVLERVKPSVKERKELKKFTDSVVSKIEKAGYKAEVEGSLAKDTWVSGNHDVDIFVFFKKNVPRETLEKKGIELGKKIVKQLNGKPEIAYAEHPYVRTNVNNFILDIVPCYKLKSTENLQSAVDRTPFHTRFIKKNLNKKMKDEARILKQFMKGVGIYSAKEKVRGFSGYLCELLIFKYKTFSNLLKKASEWEFGIVLDPAKYYKNKNEAFEKFKDPLVMIDPIDKKRNVAAALDQDNFERFIVASKAFLKTPSLNFFFPQPVRKLSKDKLETTLEKHGKIILIKFKTPNVLEDILYSQLRSSLKSLIWRLETNGFKILDSDILCNRYTYFLLEFEYTELPEIQKLEGPPVNLDKKYQEKFLRKYKKYKSWVENGRWYVEVPRKFTTPQKLLKHLLKTPQKYGIAKYIVSSLKREYTLLETPKILEEYKSEFAKFLTQYLTKKRSWDW